MEAILIVHAIINMLIESLNKFNGLRLTQLKVIILENCLGLHEVYVRFLRSCGIHLKEEAVIDILFYNAPAIELIHAAFLKIFEIKV